MIILVTNDDGIDSPGLIELTKALMALSEVWVVAPDRERNAVGRALTLHRPLRVEERSPRQFAVNGTPSDCVNLAVNSLLPEKPKLVVSGINKGANLGDDVTYSGTIAAAFEGTILGIQAFAISLAAQNHFNFLPAANFASRLAKKIFEIGLPTDTFLNVNVPDTKGKEISSFKITMQARSSYNTNPIIEKVDPRGLKYYWIGGKESEYTKIADSDYEAISQATVSITPLQTNLTNHEYREVLGTWEI